jgi:uroporphyrinogen-III decarboxylase
MTSKERIVAAWEGRPGDHIPLTTWCFGFLAPQHLRWSREGVERKFWYSKRMEHLHTLPQPWTLEDDFRRVKAWHSLGLDDVLDVSVPWSVSPEATWTDSVIPQGQADPRYPVLLREYQTPAGPVRHAVRQTGAEPDGWVIQPDHVPLIEDYNIPRAVEQPVKSPAEVPAMKYLYTAPDAQAQAWFAERMDRVQEFAGREGVPVQAWSAFGMDAAVWMLGTQGAIMLAMLEPAALGELMEIILAADLARTELAAAHPGVDMVVERGWYSSTDFWSPKLFDQFVLPSVAELARAAHQHGKKFGYVMTTGVGILGPRLADAGVDVLYFVDPVQDTITVEIARELLGGRMTLCGGTNALTLQSPDRERVRGEVRAACEGLGPTHRFILHPVDAIFPDTPWAGMEALIAAWEEYR